MSHAIRDFQKGHKNLLSKLPFVASCDAFDATHPGSIHENLHKWEKKYGSEDLAEG